MGGQELELPGGLVVGGGDREGVEEGLDEFAVGVVGEGDVGFLGGEVDGRAGEFCGEIGVVGCLSLDQNIKMQPRRVQGQTVTPYLISA